MGAESAKKIDISRTGQAGSYGSKATIGTVGNLENCTLQDYNSQLSTQGKTPAQTLYAAIFLDERDNPDTNFIKYNTRPARYYLKGLADSAKSSVLEEKAASEPSVPQIASYKEAQLHPFLSYFVSQRFNARSRTIQHNISNKKEYGEWVHPDMIVISYQSWEAAVSQLSLSLVILAQSCIPLK